MLKALLVDDEQHALNMLSKVINEREDMQVVGAYNDVAEMLDAIGGLKPSLPHLFQIENQCSVSYYRSSNLPNRFWN